VVKYIITITIFEGEKNPSKFDWIQSINNFLVKFVTVGFKWDTLDGCFQAMVDTMCSEKICSPRIQYAHNMLKLHKVHARFNKA
jgi:hypothetical protein